MAAEQRLSELLLQASGDLQKLYGKLINGRTKVTSNSVHTVSPDELYIIAYTCIPTLNEWVQTLCLMLATTHQGRV